MASFNKVFLMGNLTRDPELRVTTNGNNICKLGLAATRHYTAQDGTQREDTVFVDIDAFGRQAEVIARYMSKGRPIFIEGRLKLDQWETQTGEKRSKLGVILENFQFLNSRQDSQQDGRGPAADRASGYQDTAPPARTPSPTPTSAPTAVTVPEDIDEDVPF